MNVMTKAKLEVVPLTKHIGAEIRGIDLREKPDDATVKAIYQAWLDHLVIIFPNQNLEQHDLRRERRAVEADTRAAEGFRAHEAGNHADLQYPRERRADRRAAGRRDD